MQTYYLGDAEVEAYLRDLAKRLQGITHNPPNVWIPIGPSGLELANVLASVEPRLDQAKKLVPAEFDRDSGKVTFEATASTEINGRYALVLDSSIHSGYTMRRVVQKAMELGAANVCSYTLALKRSSKFVPSFWAVTIGDYDRAYFLLDTLPNNHFYHSHSPHDKTRTPYFHVRKLSDDDIGRPPVISGVDSLDRAKWEDRYYDMKAHAGRITCLLESAGEIIGYLTIEHDGDTLSIEAVAVDKRHKERGYGAALMRWAETIARQSEFRQISLWAIDQKVGFYKARNYKEVSGIEPLQLGEEKYTLMTKQVLAHI